MARLRTAAIQLALLGALGACGMDNRYYVRTDGSDDVTAGIAQLKPPAVTPAPLDLGVTFKSAGQVRAQASDALFKSVSHGLSSKGQWEVHRIGGPDQDFAPVIAAVAAAAARPAAETPAAYGRPRLLVLVENAPDLSGNTRLNYFLSGMSFGTYAVQRPADRYDITIAYRDAHGKDSLYRSHQDLVVATGSRWFGTGEQSVAGSRRYDSPLAAFDNIVDNSVNGVRHATITTGQPQFETPASGPAPVRQAPH
jgi:hypothetical protein